jgi:peptide subunit release factor 1 (eRF1)
MRLAATKTTAEFNKLKDSDLAKAKTYSAAAVAKDLKIKNADALAETKDCLKTGKDYKLATCNTSKTTATASLKAWNTSTLQYNEYSFKVS